MLSVDDSGSRQLRKVLLLGGEPFSGPILMWWNFVARSRAELDAAYRQWESGDPRSAGSGRRWPASPPRRRS